MFNSWPAQQIAAVQMAAAMQFQMQQLQQPQIQYNGMLPMTMAGALPSANLLDLNADVSDADDEDDEQKRTLFCANLDERVTEELLYEVFLQAGPIESARIPKDNTGRQRSFGFVTFVHACSAPYAMQLLHGLALYRKTLTIKHQGVSTPPPLPQQQQRTLPGDCERLRTRRAGDDSALRSSSYGVYCDTGESAANPFRKDIPDWTLGSAKGKERKSRPHQNSSPYQRVESSSRRSRGRDSRERDREWDRERHGNDYQRRHHNDSNRRAEQRSSSNKRRL